MRTDLHLAVAVGDYDHVSDLARGEVSTPGLDLTFLRMSSPEMFGRFAAYREWEVSEFGLGKYVALRSRGDESLTAIPVFPARAFRHSAIYVPADSGLRSLDQLAGRTVGIPEWAQTAVIYVRGMLTHWAGVPLESIDWVQAGVNEPGRTEKVKVRLPDGVRCTAMPDRTLSGMLLDGGVDAVVSAQPPASFASGRRRVRRLLEDPLTLEAKYFAETGIFPIMHLIAIRSDVLSDHPWVAGNLLSAFEEARRRSVARLLGHPVPRFPLPSAALLAERAQETYGPDLWPYGIEPNRRTIDAFLAFAHEQGVAERQMKAGELFTATTHRMFQS